MAPRSNYASGLTGVVVGSQTILQRAPNRNGAVYWIVRCACGVERPVHIGQLMNGRMSCCGACQHRTQNGPTSGAWRGGHHIPATLYNQWKRSAERRDIEWSITIKDLDDLYETQNGLCRLTKEPLVCLIQTMSRTRRGNCSLDRIDANVGYLIDNIQLVTARANMAKQSMTNIQFFELCLSVVNACLI